MEPLLSVIVPVYNTKKTLPRAVRSITASEYENMEILLVDDGSADGSGALCDALAAEDCRIRVIHQENGGISAARNAGIQMARGEYIGFVDSDDAILPQMYRRLMETALAHQADCAGCNFVDINEKGVRKDAILPLEGEFNGEEIDREIVLPMIGKRRKNVDYICSVWNKIYRSSTLQEHGIRFREILSYAEDCMFNTEFFARSHRVVFIPDVLYEYYHASSGTLSTSPKKNDLQMMIASYDIKAALYPEHFHGETERRSMIVASTRQALVDYARYYIGRKYIRFAGELYACQPVREAFLTTAVSEQYALAKTAFERGSFGLFCSWCLLAGTPVYLKQKIKKLIGRV